jgi:hypothetical protein
LARKQCQLKASTSITTHHEILKRQGEKMKKANAAERRKLQNNTGDFLMQEYWQAYYLRNRYQYP